MSYGWKPRRHIRISKDVVTRRRKPHGGSSKKENANYQESGRKLLKEFEDATESLAHEDKSSSSKQNFYFEIETKKAIEKEDSFLEPLGVKFSLQKGPSSAIMWIRREKIGELKDKIELYAEKEEFKTYVSQIKKISQVEIDKVGSDVAEWMKSDEATNVEIDILPNLGKAVYEDAVGKITELVSKDQGRISGKLVEENMASVRAFVKPETARAVIQGLDSVWQTRIAQSIVLEKPQSIDLANLPSTTAPASDLPTICVLDTGVNSRHPFLNGIVLAAENFSADSSSDDLDGHGTFVAGLAAYGNMESLGQSIEPSAKIINAKIKGGNDSDYLENRLKRAVQEFENQAKVFTLSVTYPVCSNISRPSNLAFAIDELVRKHNVFFTICTGNVRDELSALVSSRVYPSYFNDDLCTIFFGAEASAATTVGGIAHKDTNNSIAKRGQPSPFTRRGSVGKRWKPDVVSNAGNLELNNIGQPSSNNPALGVISLDAATNRLAYGLGTSYSTPIVANIVARLSREYPEAGPNLLKALLIHFADMPTNARFLDADSRLKRLLYGKGLVEYENCAFCQNSSPTYIVEDSLRYDQEARIPIYVPKEMRRVFGAKRMRVTLVYNPPVNMGVEGYTLADLDFHLYKRLKKEKLQLQTRWRREFRQKWDNVKTDILEWQHDGWGKEWILKITPVTRFRSLLPDETEQEYAVVITLEDSSGDHNLYDAIYDEQTKATKHTKTKKELPIGQTHLFPYMKTKATQTKIA